MRSPLLLAVLASVLAAAAPAGAEDMPLEGIPLPR